MSATVLFTAALTACAGEPPRTANPASVHCREAGGRLTIEKNGAGGAYGVCLFEDNRQCEEWALYRGECRAGGIRITGYDTPAARYCAIRGGAYRVTAYRNAMSPEQGVCRLPDERVCNVHAFYNGGC